MNNFDFIYSFIYDRKNVLVNYKTPTYAEKCKLYYGLSTLSFRY